MKARAYPHQDAKAASKEGLDLSLDLAQRPANEGEARREQKTADTTRGEKSSGMDGRRRNRKVRLPGAL